ncbi:MAG: extracellular solute-binding protein, partial [Eubacteriales bacterium]|nr:extracellular solute-binding protein [Eubacteriales bacterium]
MKRIITTLLSLTLLICLFACKHEEARSSQQSSQLIVFAAASLTESLNAIAESYNQEHPDLQFQFNFDSSGTLKTQLENAADCDIFISAAEKQMNALDRSHDEDSA